MDHTNEGNEYTTVEVDRVQVEKSDHEENCFIHGQCLKSKLLGTHLAPTLSECQSFCDNTTKCTWFTYLGRASTICFAYEDCENFDDSCNTCVTARFSCPSVAGIECFVPGICQGTVLEHKENTLSSGVCLLKCQESNSCQWFSYIPMRHACLLMENCAKIRPTSHHSISGHRNCKRNPVAPEIQVQPQSDTEFLPVRGSNVISNQQLPRGLRVNHQNYIRPYVYMLPNGTMTVDVYIRDGAMPVPAKSRESNPRQQNFPVAEEVRKEQGHPEIYQLKNGTMVVDHQPPEGHQPEPEPESDSVRDSPKLKTTPEEVTGIDGLHDYFLGIIKKEQIEKEQNNENVTTTDEPPTSVQDKPFDLKGIEQVLSHNKKNYDPFSKFIRGLILEDRMKKYRGRNSDVRFDQQGRPEENLKKYRQENLMNNDRLNAMDTGSRKLPKVFLHNIPYTTEEIEPTKFDEGVTEEVVTTNNGKILLEPVIQGDYFQFSNGEPLDPSLEREDQKLEQANQKLELENIESESGKDDKKGVSAVLETLKSKATNRSPAEIAQQIDQIDKSILTEEKIVVVGGVGAKKDVEIVSAGSTNKVNCSKPPDFPFPVYGHVAEVLNERLLVCGNSMGAEAKSTLCYQLNPITDEWTPISPMKNRRFLAASVSTPEGFAVFGGFDGSKLLDSLEIFRGRGWQPIPGMPLKLWRSCAVQLNNTHTIMFGGKIGRNKETGRVFIFNWTTKIWSELPSMLYERASHMCVLLDDGRVLATGGKNSWGWVRETEVYNPMSNDWTVGPELPFGWKEGKIVMANHKPTIVSGSSENALQSGEVRLLQLYDDKWSESPIKLQKARFHATANLVVAPFLPGCIDKMIDGIKR